MEVCLERIGQLEVYDGAYVGLIDTHTKGIGSHYHTCAAPLPSVLLSVLVVGGKPCVEKIGTDTVFVKEIGNLFRLLPATHVYDRCACYTAEYPEHLLELVVGMAYDVVEVLSLETLSEDPMLRKPQFVLNIVDYDGRSRSRQSQYRHSGIQHIEYIGYMQIRRAEVVAPLRDTVSLIDRYHTYSQKFHVAQKQLRLQPFRRDVEELKIAVLAVFERRKYLFVRHTRIDGSGFDASGTEILDLVFHQCHQRRHHQTQPVESHRRHLKGDRLTAARRHQR